MYVCMYVCIHACMSFSSGIWGFTRVYAECSASCYSWTPIFDRFIFVTLFSLLYITHFTLILTWSQFYFAVIYSTWINVSFRYLTSQQYRSIGEAIRHACPLLMDADGSWVSCKYRIFPYLRLTWRDKHSHVHSRAYYVTKHHYKVWPSVCM